jgi:hypothetical protein
VTTQEEIALIMQGQIEADRQMLETLTSLDPVAYDQFIYIYENAYCDIPLVDFVQVWRELYEA